jgi:hypothetical protein
MSEQLKKFSQQAGTRVRIPWKIGDTITDWNETCARAIEMFGLPGDKFTTHLTEDHLDFVFTDGKDAIMFELTCG